MPFVQGGPGGVEFPKMYGKRTERSRRRLAGGEEHTTPPALARYTPPPEPPPATEPPPIVVSPFDPLYGKNLEEIYKKLEEERNREAGRSPTSPFDPLYGKNLEELYRKLEEERRPKPPPLIHIHRGAKPKHRHGGVPHQDQEELFLSGVRATVDSSWIREVQYVPNLQHLRVWFLDGFACTVLKVTRWEAAELYNSDSIGGWYHARVLGPGYVPGSRRSLKEWMNTA